MAALDRFYCTSIPFSVLLYEYSFLRYSVPEYFSEYVETEDEEIFYILELELAKVSRCIVIFIMKQKCRI